MSQVKKSEKVVGRDNRRPSIDSISMDDLAIANDDELKARLDFLCREIERRERSGKDAKAFEVELCYVQRELGIREQRAALHVTFMEDERRALAEWRKFISESSAGSWRDRDDRDNASEPGNRDKRRDNRRSR
jgi:hypothetical protein